LASVGCGTAFAAEACRSWAIGEEKVRGCTELLGGVQVEGNLEEPAIQFTLVAELPVSIFYWEHPGTIQNFCFGFKVSFTACFIYS